MGLLSSSHGAERILKLPVWKLAWTMAYSTSKVIAGVWRPHGDAIFFSWSKKDTETTHMEISMDWHFPLLLLFCSAELFHNVLVWIADKLDSSFAFANKMDRAPISLMR